MIFRNFSYKRSYIFFDLSLWLSPTMIPFDALHDNLLNFKLNMYFFLFTFWQTCEHTLSFNQDLNFRINNVIIVLYVQITKLAEVITKN